MYVFPMNTLGLSTLYGKFQNGIIEQGTDFMIEIVTFYHDYGKRELEKH